MSSLKCIWNNLCDVITLSSTGVSFDTNLPLANLTLQGRSSMSRTTSMGTTYITGDFEVASSVGGFVLWNHNMSTSGTLQLKLYSDPGQTGTLLYDTGEVDKDGNIVVGGGGIGSPADLDDIFKEWPALWTALFFAEVSAVSSFELTWYDNSLEGYMEASRIIIGPVFSPNINANWGAQVGWSENTNQSITQGGSVYSNLAIPARVMNFDLNQLVEAERAEVMAMRRRIGKRRDFFLSLYPDGSDELRRDHEMLCKFTSTDLVTAPGYSQFSNRFQVRET